MGDLPRAAGDHSRGGRFRQQHALDVAAFEQSQVCGRGAEDDLDIALQVNAVACGDDPSKFILFAALRLRRDTLADEIFRLAIPAVAPADPADMEVGARS